MKRLDDNEAAQYFESISTVANEGILVVDQDGIILKVNPAFGKILGYEEHEVLGKHFYNIILKDKVPQSSIPPYPLHQFYIAEKASIGLTFYDKQGREVPVRFRSVVIRDEHDQVKQAIGRVEHLVELTGTDEGGVNLADKIWEAQQNFESVFNNSADAIVICDSSGHVTMANRAFSQLIDYTQEEVNGGHIMEFTPYTEGTYATTTGEELIVDEEFVTSTVSRMAGLFEKGHISNWETYFVKKDKVHVPVEATLSVLKDKDGERRGSVTILRDITERKKTEEELSKHRKHLEELVEERTSEIKKAHEQLKLEITERRQAEEESLRLSTAIEQADETMMITGIDGTIQYANPALERLMGYGRDELIDKKQNFFEQNEEQKLLYEKAWETINKGQVWSGHITPRKKDGSICEMDITVSPVRDQSGEITSFVSIGRDVTKELKLEEQLRQSQKMEAIGTLAGGIAHDFNNILTVIMGFTEMSLDKVAGTKVYNNLRQVLSSAKRAKDLVQQILTFSRQTDQEIKPVSIKPIVKETFNFLRSSLPATIEIRQKIQAESDTVISDPTQIHQILMNLCTNAKHAMMEKGGVLEIGLTEEALDEEDAAFYSDLSPGQYLKLTVSDTGYGMERSVMKKIFDPFFTTKKPDEGTGMGLSVVHGIVKSCGGDIKVYSEPGKGTTFHVYLPLAETEAFAPESISSGQVTGGSERVLLVEDEQQVFEMIKQMLEELGYQVTARISSIEALETFREHPEKFDFVITDQTMPNMTGAQLSRELMAIRPDIPIILCTGFSEVITEEKAKAVCIRAFIMKPIVRSKLARTIREVLDKRREE